MATKAQKESFLKMIIPIAQRQAKKHSNKIYSSVCIAQAAQESGWGTSEKMINANAVYGIKVGNSAWHFGKAWHDKAYNTGTTEYYDGVNPTKIVDWFRAYSSIEDATEDYFDMLTTCKRYRPACNESSPKRCIEAIVRGGYATGPEYAKHIMDIIKKNNLTRFDSDPLVSSTVLKRGDRGDEVVKIQLALYNRGYDVGKIDGIFGPKTEDAVRAFQADHKVKVDGKVGAITSGLLD